MPQDGKQKSPGLKKTRQAISKRRAMTYMVAALWPAGVAMAQNAPAASAPVATKQDDAIPDVIVTAQRRSESVQKSSLAIQVLNGDQLQEAGIVQMRDLGKLVSGVQIGQGGSATQIYVRGVGDFTATPVTNPAVAVNVDGVYVARAQAIDGLFYDLERVEVLKGPQGTLYGRNASAGAINVITAKPSFKRRSLDFGVEIGKYNMRKGELAINLPVSEQLAVRGAMQVVKRDGYASQGMDDDDHRSARVSALLKPNADLSVLFQADYTHVGGKGPAYVFKAVDAGLAAALAAQGVALPIDPRANGSDPTVQNVYYGMALALGRCIPNAVLASAATASGPAPITTLPQGACPAGQSSLLSPPGSLPFADAAYVDNTFKNASLELNWNLGGATLTMLPAVRKVSSRYVTYPLITYNNNATGEPEHSLSKSMEVRLGDSTASLKWVVGLYWFNEEQRAGTSGSAGGINGASLNRYAIETNSHAAFGQFTYSLSAPLRLIGGLRYTDDTKYIDGVNLTAYPSLAYAAGQPCYKQPVPCVRDVFKGERSFRNTSYKVGLEYDATRDSMLFATLATGYKAGGSNPGSAPGTKNEALFFGPEKLTALEVGSRNRFLDGRLRANVEAFYWRYQDAQEFYSTLNAGGNAVNAVTNAGAASLYGVDLDITYKLSRNDTLQLGAEFMRSNFDEFRYPAAGQIQGVTTGCQVTSGGPFPILDCAGQPLPRAPKYSGSARYTHRFELDSGARLEASLSLQFAGSRYLTVDYNQASLAKSYRAGDINLAYTSADEKWNVAGYVRNVGNANIYTGAYSIATLFRSLTLANIGAPRTFGASVSVHY
jgi:iron complex outermembrane receptor protein